MKRLAGLFLFGVATLAPSLAHADVIVFDQLPGSLAGAWASQNDPGGFGQFATVYDNFTLAGSELITSVEWEGQFFVGSVYPSFPPTNGITAFTVTFYADAAGQPGGVLQSATVAGNAGQSSIGLGTFGPAFHYGLDLPVDFAANGGTQYWLSIVPDLAYPPQWAWNKTSPPGAGLSYQDFFGERIARDDVAFRLHAAVPEPSTILLVAVGCAAALRRRLTRRA